MIKALVVLPMLGFLLTAIIGRRLGKQAHWIPVGAIFLDHEMPEAHRTSIPENADFFLKGLPGSTEPARP